MDSFRQISGVLIFAFACMINVSMAEEVIDSDSSDEQSLEREFEWLEKPKPIFPKEALYDPGCGYVDLKFNISRDQKIINIRVEKSSHKIFEKNAIRALRNAKFRFTRPAVQNDGLMDLSLRLRFENEFACGAKSIRPKDPTTDVSYCLQLFTKLETQRAVVSSLSNLSDLNRLTGYGLNVARVKLLNQCPFSVRASFCYSYFVNSKSIRGKCKKEVLVLPTRIKEIGKVTKYTENHPTLLGYSSVACLSRKSENDEFVEPKLVYDFSTDEETQMKIVTGHCESSSAEG